MEEKVTDLFATGWPSASGRKSPL